MPRKITKQESVTVANHLVVALLGDSLVELNRHWRELSADASALERLQGVTVALGGRIGRTTICYLAARASDYASVVQALHAAQGALIVGVAPPHDREEELAALCRTFGIESIAYLASENEPIESILSKWCAASPNERLQAARRRPPRMQVEHCVGKPSGSLVMGTLVSGVLNVGDQVEFFADLRRRDPTPVGATVVGLELFRQPGPQVAAGMRVAIDLRHDVDRQPTTGTTLGAAGQLIAAQELMVACRPLLKNSPSVEHNMRVLVNFGAGDVKARLLLRPYQSWQTAPPFTVALLKTEYPIVVAMGEPLIIQTTQPKLPVSGGFCLLPYPLSPSFAVRRYGKAECGALLDMLRAQQGGAQGSDDDALKARRSACLHTAIAMCGSGGVSIRALAALFNQPPVEIGKRLQESLLAGDLVVQDKDDRGDEQRLVNKEFVRATLSERKKPKAAQKPGAKTPTVPITQRIEELTEQAKFTPLRIAELAHLLNAPIPVVRGFSESLIKNGRLVAVDNDYLLHVSARDELSALVAAHFAAQDTLTLAQFKAKLRVARRQVVALLEYLDAQGITERLPDDSRRRGKSCTDS